MAKKKDDAEAVKDRVGKLLGRGEVRGAVELVKSSDLAEGSFDDVMEAFPVLRDVYEHNA